MTMDTQPDVAAIISAYRPHPAQLARQLRSLKAQEGVVVHPFILEVGAEGPSGWQLPPDVDTWSEVHVCSSRVNLPMAWNYLCMVAWPDWCVIANTDDWWEPDGIRKLVDLAEDQGSSFAYGDVMCHDGERNPYSGVTKPHTVSSIRESVDIGCCALFARERLLELGGFDTTLEIAADWDAWIKLSADGIAYTADIVGHFTVRSESLSHADPAALRGELARVRRRYRHG